MNSNWLTKFEVMHPYLPLIYLSILHNFHHQNQPKLICPKTLPPSSLHSPVLAEHIGKKRNHHFEAKKFKKKSYLLQLEKQCLRIPKKLKSHPKEKEKSDRTNYKLRYANSIPFWKISIVKTIRSIFERKIEDEFLVCMTISYCILIVIKYKPLHVGKANEMGFLSYTRKWLNVAVFGFS